MINYNWGGRTKYATFEWIKAAPTEGQNATTLKAHANDLLEKMAFEHDMAAQVLGA